MNKATPNDVIVDFVDNTKIALADWESTNALLKKHAPKADRLRLQRRLASEAFLALTIAWEGFISTWIIAAVNRAPKNAIATLSKKVENYAVGDLRVPANALAATLVTHKDFNLDNIKKMLDSKGQNVAVRGIGQFHNVANTWLDGNYQSVVKALNGHDYSPANIGRLVRNVFAHGSDSALNEADAYARLTTVHVNYRITVANKPGTAYWRAYTLQVPSGETDSRVKLFHEALIDLATKLTVP